MSETDLSSSSKNHNVITSNIDLQTGEKTTPSHIDALIEEFRAFLLQDSSSTQSPANNPEQVNLYDLFTELLALKNEVKRESMQVKDAFTKFGSVLDTLKTNNQQLSNELEQRNHQQKNTLFAYRLPLIEDMLDLNESLERSINSLKSHQPSWWAKRSKKTLAFHQEIIKGMEITLRRIKKTLSQHDIKETQCLGKTLDPKTMKAIKVESHQQKQDGTVIEVLRKGYSRHGETIRIAEVCVNKIPQSDK